MSSKSLGLGTKIFLQWMHHGSASIIYSFFPFESLIFLLVCPSFFSEGRNTSVYILIHTYLFIRDNKTKHYINSTEPSSKLEIQTGKVVFRTSGLSEAKATAAPSVRYTSQEGINRSATGLDACRPERLQTKPPYPSIPIPIDLHMLREVLPHHTLL